MTDHGPGTGDQRNIRFGEPYPMTNGKLGTEQAQVGEVLHRRGPRAAPSVLLLIRRFEYMHVQPDLIGRGIILQSAQGGIRAPMQVGGSELNTRPLVGMPA